MFFVFLFSFCFFLLSDPFCCMIWFCVIHRSVFSLKCWINGKLYFLKKNLRKKFIYLKKKRVIITLGCSVYGRHKQNQREDFTFSARVKIFLWSTPPNWASTFRYSSSRAWRWRLTLRSGITKSKAVMWGRVKDDETRSTGSWYLEAGVQEAAEQRMLHLLDDLSSSLLGVMLRHHGGQAVHIEGVLSWYARKKKKHGSMRLASVSLRLHSRAKLNGSRDNTDLLSW